MVKASTFKPEVTEIKSDVNCVHFTSYNNIIPKSVFCSMIKRWLHENNIRFNSSNIERDKQNVIVNRAVSKKVISIYV